MLDNRPSRRSGRGAEESRGRGLAAVLYCGTALVAALVFWTATTFAGSFPAVARYGGAAWIFVLMMIVLMPIVIPRVRSRVTARPMKEPSSECPLQLGEDA